MATVGEKSINIAIVWWLLFKTIPDYASLLFFSLLICLAITPTNFCNIAYALKRCPQQYGYEGQGGGLAFETGQYPKSSDSCAFPVVTIEPPVVIAKENQNMSVIFSLHDGQTAKVLPHVTYNITIARINDMSGSTIMLQDIFHSHNGTLIINFQGKDGSSSPSRDSSLGDAIMVDANGIINITSTLPALGGLYKVHTDFLGINNDTLQIDSLRELSFDSYFSIGMAYSKNIQFEGLFYNATVTSYFTEVQDFSFDSKTRTFSWKIPFDWHTLPNQNNATLFVHEHLAVPKSFPGFSNYTASFSATVNGITITGRMLAIDPYSSQTEMIFHYLLNKNDLNEMAQWMRALNYTGMEFTLSPNIGIPKVHETSTILHGKRTDIFIKWTPDQLASRNNSTVFLEFVNKETGQRINGDVHYFINIRPEGILEPIANKVGLIAKNGTDSQTLVFPRNGTYMMDVFIASIDQPEPPSDDNGDFASGVVVVPEFGSSVALITAAISSGLVILASRRHLMKKK